MSFFSPGSCLALATFTRLQSLRRDLNSRLPFCQRLPYPHPEDSPVYFPLTFKYDPYSDGVVFHPSIGLDNENIASAAFSLLAEGCIDVLVPCLIGPFLDDWLDEQAEKRMGLAPRPTERLCPDCYTWHAGSECW